MSARAPRGRDEASRAAGRAARRARRGIAPRAAVSSRPQPPRQLASRSACRDTVAQRPSPRLPADSHLASGADRRSLANTCDARRHPLAVEGASTRAPIGAQPRVCARLCAVAAIAVLPRGAALRRRGEAHLRRVAGDAPRVSEILDRHGFLAGAVFRMLPGYSTSPGASAGELLGAPPRRDPRRARRRPHPAALPIRRRRISRIALSRLEHAACAARASLDALLRLLGSCAACAPARSLRSGAPELPRARAGLPQRLFRWFATAGLSQQRRQPVAAAPPPVPRVRAA